MEAESFNSSVFSVQRRVDVSKELFSERSNGTDEESLVASEDLFGDKLADFLAFTVELLHFEFSHEATSLFLFENMRTTKSELTNEDRLDRERINVSKVERVDGEFVSLAELSKMVQEESLRDISPSEEQLSVVLLVNKLVLDRILEESSINQFLLQVVGHDLIIRVGLGSEANTSNTESHIETRELFIGDERAVFTDTLATIVLQDDFIRVSLVQRDDDGSRLEVKIDEFFKFSTIDQGLSQAFNLFSSDEGLEFFTHMGIEPGLNISGSLSHDKRKMKKI